MKIFLGGTCNNSMWREKLIPLLESREINYFNPVVDDWNEEAQENEKREKEICDVHLYVITPKMKSIFSIAEAVDDSHNKNCRCIFFVFEKYEGQTFEKHHIMSLTATCELIRKNGGIAYMSSDFTNVWDDSDMINQLFKTLLYLDTTSYNSWRSDHELS